MLRGSPPRPEITAPGPGARHRPASVIHHVAVLDPLDVAPFGDKGDCHRPHLGLTVELVSYRFHASRQAFERDVARRRRSSHLAYTYGDAFERGEATIADVRPRLGQAATSVR